MKRIFSIIFGMLFFFGIASAQDSAFKNLPQQWSLQDCIAYAQQQNIQLHSLKLSVASAEQDLIQSKANACRVFRDLVTTSS